VVQYVKLSAEDGAAGDQYYLDTEYTTHEGKLLDSWHSIYALGDDWRRQREIRTGVNGAVIGGWWEPERIGGDNGQDGWVPEFEIYYGADGTAPFDALNPDLSLWHKNLVNEDIFKYERTVWWYSSTAYLAARNIDQGIDWLQAEAGTYTSTPWVGPTKIKPEVGVDYGYETALIFLYQRSASKVTAPAAPTGAIRYTFETLAVTEVTAGAFNGWSTQIPSGTDNLWVAAASTRSIAPTDDIATNEWVIELMAPNGADGATGVYTSYIYINSDTVPADAMFAAGSYDGTTEVFPQVTAGVYYTDDPQTPAAGETTYIRIGKYKHTPATELVAESWNIHTVTYASGWSTATKFSSDTIYEIYEYSPDGIVGTDDDDWSTDLRLTDFYRRTATVTNGSAGEWSSAVVIRNSIQYDIYEYSIDGSTLWHTDYLSGDLYRRTTVYTNGVAGEPSVAARVTGNTPIEGTDYYIREGAFKSYVYKSSATAAGTPPNDGTFIGGVETAPTAWSGNPTYTVDEETYVSTGIYEHDAVADTWALNEDGWSVSVIYSKAGYSPIKGTDYVDGIDGNNVRVEYSANGTTGWTVTLDSTTHRYIRTAVDVNGSGSYTAGNATKFVPEKGVEYDDGDDGTSSYLHIKYSDNGTTFTGNSGEDLGTYIGTRVDNTLSDSTTFNDYTWQKYIGDDGYSPVKGTDYDDGVAGNNVRVEYSVDGTGSWTTTLNPVTHKYIRTAVDTNGNGVYVGGNSSKFIPEKGVEYDDGDDGTSSYLHIKYSDNGTTFTGNGGEDLGTYIGTKVDTTLVDSTTFGDYTWKKIVGEVGATPVNGSDYYINEGKFKSYIFFTNATQPETPTTGATFDGTTEVAPTAPDVWTDNPYFTAGEVTWVSSAVWTNNKEADTWTHSAWSTPAEYSEKGDTGLDGDYTSYVYRNATAAPTDIDTDADVTDKGTYSGTLEVPPTLWSDDPSTPTAPDVTWVSKARYYQANDGTWLRANGWSTPTKFTGKDAWSTKTVVLYQVKATAPLVPDNNITYTFATGGLVGSLDGWFTTAPENTAEGGKVWTTFNTALSQGATDVLDVANWSTPEVMVQNGTNGINGISITGAAGLHGSGSYVITTAAATTKATVLAYTQAVKDGHFTTISGRAPQNKDILSYVNDTATDKTLRFRIDYLYNGTDWVDFIDVVNGNQIVHGTVAAEHIKASTITGNNIDAQTTIIAGSGSTTSGMNGYDLATLPDWLGGGTNDYANYRFWAGATDPSLANFSVSDTGILKASNAEISGTITIGNTALTESNTVNSNTVWADVAGTTNAPDNNATSNQSDTTTNNAIQVAAGTSSWSGISSRPSNSRLFTNLLDVESWEVGTSGTQGTFSQNGSTAENKVVMGFGPNGESQPIWESSSDGDNSANGGWNNTIYDIDHTKTYRSLVWMKQESGNGSKYFGCQGASINKLNGTANNNPYFWSGDLPTSNKWYLLVGVVHGSGYGTSYSGVGGLYDPDTGSKVISFTEYKHKVGATTNVHRAYLYYDVLVDDTLWFARPRYELVDGTEPSILSLMSSGALLNSNTTKTDVDLGNVDNTSDATVLGGNLTGSVGGTAVATIKSGAAAGSTANQSSNATIRAVGAATSGTTGGWTIDSNSIYSGTKDTGGFAPADSITLYSGGSIHTPWFYSQASGAGFKGDISLATGTLTAANINANNITGDVTDSLARNLNANGNPLLSFSVASMPFARTVVISGTTYEVSAPLFGSQTCYSKVELKRNGVVVDSADYRTATVSNDDVVHVCRPFTHALAANTSGSYTLHLSVTYGSATSTQEKVIISVFKDGSTIS